MFVTHQPAQPQRTVSHNPTAEHLTSTQTIRCWACFPSRQDSLGGTRVHKGRVAEAGLPGRTLAGHHAPAKPLRAALSVGSHHTRTCNAMHIAGTRIGSKRPDASG